MSNGPFTRGFYAADNGDILSIRYQPESVIPSFNPAATGPATVKGSAKITGGKRNIGTIARCVYGVWAADNAGYKAGSRVRIPIFTKAAYDAINNYSTFTYLGGSVTVTGTRAESRR